MLIPVSIERGCAALGMMVLLGDTQNDPEIELRVVRELINRKVDGLILAAGRPEVEGGENSAVTYLKSIQAPFVLVDRLARDDTAGVALENTESMDTLVGHLA